VPKASQQTAPRRAPLPWELVFLHAMDIEVLTDSKSVAQRAASIIADDGWEAIAARWLVRHGRNWGYTHG
jgi:hypothetical protein